MTIMQKEFPERVFDVGIAEGHAVTFSAGLSKAGMIPFCNIYSSFLQRAYDNIIHDVALLKQHVVLCIDRAGIVGNDGATHHGLLDLAYLRPIPHMTIASPRTGEELQAMMHIAVDYNGPIAIRYPRGKAAWGEYSPVQVGRGERLTANGTRIAILSLGAIGNTVESAICELPVTHYAMRWLKPFDTTILDEVGQHFQEVVTIEDGVISGGLGSAVLEYFADKGYSCHVHRMGIDDRFVEHGSTKDLYHMLGLDKEGIHKALQAILDTTKQ